MLSPSDSVPPMLCGRKYMVVPATPYASTLTVETAAGCDRAENGWAESGFVNVPDDS